MTTDLWMLAWSTVFCVLIPVPGVTVLLQIPGGPKWGFGNRDYDFPVPAWIARGRRAHANMVENLLPFACLVLVAHLGGKANATTALASEIFLASRVVYTLVYMAGIPVLRTVIFGLGVVADFMIFFAILR
jgi:uncharacterized MAPEG superfamily protein